MDLIARLNIKVATEAAGLISVEQICESGNPGDYRPQAIRPTAERGPLTDVLSRAVLTGQTKDLSIGSLVGLLGIDGNTLSELRLLANRRETKNFSLSDMAKLIRVLTEALKTRYSIEGRVDVAYYESVGGQYTTTRDKGIDGKFVGLHVDDWDNDPIEQRRSSRNRISINLGTESRDFIFCPIDVLEMQGHLRNSGTLTTSDTASSSARKYLRLNPQTPLLRCQIPPGWAYIAPTENCIHDGSTSDQTSSDMTFVVRSRIRGLKAIV